MPIAAPVSSIFISSPPWTDIFVPERAVSFLRMLTISTFETAVMDARASPRKPMVSTLSISSIVPILLVVCLRYEIVRSSLVIPSPSSTMRIPVAPPPSTSILISVALASMEFSISSFTTDAGLSMTSPAAILFIVLSSSGRILFSIYDCT